jgi:curli biogenesis system outer membrane secretion channel CsgG
MNAIVYKILFFALLLIGAGPSLEASMLGKYGPKIRIAVAQFGATDHFAAVYGGWNLGGGLSAQLVTSLINSGRVVVVERATLSKVLIEQELGQSQLSSPFTQTPAGQLLGVDYLIVGQVTEFEERQMGGGASLSVMKGFGPKISGDVMAAHVGIDLRVIDTRTGEILHSHRSQGRAWEKAGGAKIDYKLVDFGGEIFHKTPLGKATRRAITDAMGFILGVVEKRTENFSWLARVIEIDGPYVYFDAGKLANIEIGNRFLISSVEKVLTDPETNEILGLVEHNIGQVEAVTVDLKYTKAQIRTAGPISIGDLVRFASEKNPAQASPKTLIGYKILE